MPRGPILITGVYRTGSTLLTRILDQHPELRVTYDRANFFRFYLDRADPIEERYLEILEEAHHRFETRWQSPVPVESVRRRVEADPPVTFAKLYDAFMRETFCDGTEGVRWGEKTLLQWSNIPLFLHMFPSGQVLHVMRDPRAIVASQREITWETPFRYLDAIFVCLHSMNWAATTGATLSRDSYRIVRYEDVVCRPETTVRGISDFLEVEFVPEMIEPSRFRTHDGDLWKPNSAFGDVGTTLSSTPSERWRQTLETWEVALVESFLFPLMSHFGYEASGVEVTSSDLSTIWESLRATPLLQRRLGRWFDTGEGVEGYPSDPRVPQNWAKHKFR